MSIRRLGLVVHEGRPAAVTGARTVRDWCGRHDIGCVDIDVWGDHENRRSGRDEMAAAGSLDLIVTLGGDGTFLRGARVAAKKDIQVLGVDLGRVGFLTEIAVDDVELALEAVLAGESGCEERMTLTMRASRMLEMPSGVDALLSYGRGAALPPPKVRPETDEGEGWGWRSTSPRSTTSCWRSWPGTGRSPSASTSRAGCSPPTPPTA